MSEAKKIGGMQRLHSAQGKQPKEKIVHSQLDFDAAVKQVDRFSAYWESHKKHINGIIKITLVIEIL